MANFYYKFPSNPIKSSQRLFKCDDSISGLGKHHFVTHLEARLEGEILLDTKQ